VGWASSRGHLDSVGGVPCFPEGFADGVGLGFAELWVVVAEFHDDPKDEVVNGSQVDVRGGVDVGHGVLGGAS